MTAIKDQKSIIFRVANFIEKEGLIAPGDTVIVACSGGADSIALLTLLFDLKARFSFNLEACHYNHKLRGEDGDRDERYVKKYCDQLNIPLRVEERTSPETIKNEEDARNLRYKFFEKILEEKGGEGVKIALAHHLDDLAETFLMRLTRGSSLKGLSSILPQRKNFIRPLLQISKEEIVSFLGERKISFCQDSTNFQDIFFRNRIRNQLIPLLKSYNPRIIENIYRTSCSAAEIYDYVAEQAQTSAQGLVVEKQGECYVIDRAGFVSLHPALQKELIVHCLEELGGRDYTSIQIQNILDLIERNVGKKTLPLPHSLRFEFKNGKIYLCDSEFISFEENNGKSKKK